MNSPTQAQVYSFGRHVLTYAMGGISVFTAMHIGSDAQLADAKTAITQISTGVGSIITGGTTLVALASAFYAAWSASPFAQLLSVSKNPEVKQVVVNDPVLAQKLPENVVAK